MAKNKGHSSKPRAKTRFAQSSGQENAAQQHPAQALPGVKSLPASPTKPLASVTNVAVASSVASESAAAFTPVGKPQTLQPTFAQTTVRAQNLDCFVYSEHSQ